MNNKNNRVFLAPAMNTFMWNHPITAKQINILEEFGYNIIMPINKTLACGDHGKFIFFSVIIQNNYSRNRRYGRN